MRKKVALFLLVAMLASLSTTYAFGGEVRGATSASGTEAAVTAGVSPLARPIRNLWGAPRGESVDVSLYRSGDILGWRWSRPNPEQLPSVDYLQPIYPSARITLEEPVAVGDVSSFNLIADFRYAQTPSGDYSLAYEVFLRENGTKAEKAEIMIVLDRTQPQPAPPVKGSFSDGVNSYKLYSWTRANGCLFRSFWLAVPAASNPYLVNLKALIDQIRADKDWYISEVELGTEVWDGSGAVDLTDFHLELNGLNL